MKRGVFFGDAGPETGGVASVTGAGALVDGESARPRFGFRAEGLDIGL